MPVLFRSATIPRGVQGTNPGSPAASWKAIRDRTGVTSHTLDTYVGKSSVQELAAAQFPQRVGGAGPPEQLAFRWTRHGLEATLTDEDAAPRRCRVDPGSETERRVLQLVRDVNALAVAVPVAAVGQEAPARGLGRREHRAGRQWTRTKRTLAGKPRLV